MNKNYVFGFLAGLSVGAVAGMLYPPRSSAKLRRLAADKTKLVSDKTKDGIQTAKDHAQELWDTANQALDKGQAGLAGTQERLKAVVDAGKKAYQEAASH